jgi:hypothetical protein
MVSYKSRLMTIAVACVEDCRITATKCIVKMVRQTRSERR